MARPAGDIRPPGVYVQHVDATSRAISLADTRICGLVGMTAKGPMNVPTRIASFDEFSEVYGNIDIGHMANAVEGYFLNGGTACWVVRVAHTAREGAAVGPEHASFSELAIKDGLGKPTLKVRARSEGRWGNNVWVRFSHSTGAKALLTADLDVGSGEALVSQTRGFERGALVRVYDRNNSDFVVLTEVHDRIVRWASATPINRRYRAAGPTYFEVVELELHVSLRDRRETFRSLQLDPSSRRYINRIVEEESRLVAVEDLQSRSPWPHKLPKPEDAIKLSNGRDGSELVTPEDMIGYDHGPAERAGLMALAAIEEVALLSVPDAMLFPVRKPGPEGDLGAQRVHDAMINMCELQKDRFAILDCPLTRDIEVVRRWRRRTDSSFCAYYWPWVGIVEADGKVVKCPPSGHMAGMFARLETEVGVHRAPANEPLKGIVDLSVPITEDDQGLLNSEAINVFRMSRGIRPWGARTASSDIDWRFVNVRRLFIMLRRALEENTRWVVFEPNTPNTWDSLRSRVQFFLEKLFEKGMFAGGSPEDCFYVKCDGETNSPEVREVGQLVVEVGVAPAIPTEFIVIRVTQKLGEEGHAPPEPM